MNSTFQKKLAGQILLLLKEKYPIIKTALNYNTPFELLVATILSAQCTDKRVNIVTPALFAKFKTPEDYVNTDINEVKKLIRSTGFYNNKAKNIVNCSHILVEEFDSEVPKTMEELLKLPGVARKTANVVLHGAFGISEGIAVDTHVKRLSYRLGLSKNTDPIKIEQDLMKLFPKNEWGDLSLRLVQFGRDVCIARKPHCEVCVMNNICPSAFKIKQ